MEVHFPLEVQAKLEQMARDTGNRSDEIVNNVVTDFFSRTRLHAANARPALRRSGERQD